MANLADKQCRMCSNEAFQELQQVIVVGRGNLARVSVPCREVHKRVQDKARQVARSMLAEEDGRILSLFGMSLEYKEACQKDGGLVDHFTALEYLRFQRI
jgi:hypothetical protein